MRDRLKGMTIHKSRSGSSLLGNLNCEYHSAMSSNKCIILESKIKTIR